MSKVYDVDKLIKVSYFNEYINGVSSDRMFSITSIIENLLEENKEYCDDKNYEHVANIFCTIAVYKTLIQEGNSVKDAYDIVANKIWDYIKERKSKYQSMYKLPYALKIANELVPKMIDASSGHGWNYTWHLEQNKNDRLQYECTSCIYQQLFAKYNLPFFGPVYCYCDYLKYGDLEDIQFTRNHTLCQDGQPCDFLFTRKK